MVAAKEISKINREAFVGFDYFMIDFIYIDANIFQTHFF